MQGAVEALKTAKEQERSKDRCSGDINARRTGGARRGGRQVHAWGRAPHRQKAASQLSVQAAAIVTGGDDANLLPS